MCKLKLITKAIAEPKSRKCLFPAALSFCLALLSSGCVRHRTVQNSNGFILHSETELALLTPPAQGHEEGNVRTTKLVLGDPESKLQTAKPLNCSILGDVFSLAPSSEETRAWVVTSPSLHGWQVRESQLDVTEEWQAFVEKLSILQQSHCFPRGLDVYAIQRAIVRSIPFPADQALLFAYSFGNTGFVDLEPGLRIEVEGSTTNRSRSNSVQFDVVAATTGVGVKLKSSRWKLLGSLDMDANLSHVVQAFKTTPFLRLFLYQGTTQSQPARDPMLLGATSVQELTNATQRISQAGTSACATPSKAVKCVVFANGGVSLLASVIVNNRAHFYPPGTTLGQILDALPDKQQGQALATVAVERPLGHGLYATIAFPHSVENVQLLILLSGDRVRWS